MKHPHFEAAQMAALDLNTMLKGMKDSPMGQFPMSGAKSSGTRARDARIASSQEAQDLLDQGFTKMYADLVAKAAKRP